jgi:hypothetical protein
VDARPRRRGDVAGGVMAEPVVRVEPDARHVTATFAGETIAD